MAIQVALWATAILLLILVIDFERAIGRAQDSLERIQRTADRWEQSQREPLSFPETKPTKEEEQKRDEFEQQQLRLRVQHECGGWQIARITCRRSASSIFGCEYV